MNLEKLVRPNIWKLKPYSSARSEFKGEASVFLDANENPYNYPYNRYPDPLQRSLKDKIARLKGVSPSQIMIGNGSDEPIDLTYRIFCEPQKDNVVAIDPTYGMYEVCADINNIEYRKVPLDTGFSLNAGKILEAVDASTKLIFLCSPNNPTGNLLDRKEILQIITQWKGIVIIDEAYIDFSAEKSWLTELDSYPNLIVLQTFSKAWGLASVRCGLAFASEDIISFFNKVKYPYNINLLTQNFVSQQLDKEADKNEWVKILLKERKRLKEELEKCSWIEIVYPSDSNSLLVKVPDANATYQYLVDKGIIVRNRHTVSLCLNCLRITIGSPEENAILLNELKNIRQ